MSEPIQIPLSRDEALVLLDWLAANVDTLSFRDQAEQRVLWDIEAMLEAQLVEPFASNYAELLQAARARVRDPEG
jgi:hypothetical protein